MKTITCPSKEVPVIAETQVLVVGSGPAGISAAVASARCGAKTMLVERYGCFGGALFVGQVESYTWYFNKNTYTAQGISKEIEDRMIKIGGVQDDDRGCGHFLNPEKYKYMLDWPAYQMLSDHRKRYLLFEQDPPQTLQRDSKDLAYLQ